VPREFGTTASRKLGVSVSRTVGVIQGQYLDDILHQPQAVRATLEGLRSSEALARVSSLLAEHNFERIVLTGMGSSYFALHPLAMELAEHGWTPILLETSELVHYYPRLLTGSTLVVAVSQSGQSAETLRLLKHNGDQQVVVAVTNTAESPLAEEADVSVLTRAGEEFSVSCKTYVAALVALPVLSAVLCGLDVAERLAELEPAAAAVEEYLRYWEAHVAEFHEILRDIRHLFLVGRGPSLAAVGTGALIIKESDHFHAEGMSCAAFRHGPFEMLTPEAYVGVFAGDRRTRSLNERLLADIEEHGTRSALIGADAKRAACRIPDTSPMVQPILEILPVQMITIALAALANREAGKFERATKVTIVE
jgi:glucosamine--fructose-6-phosphate aminotransferase (isomerizing)